MDLQLEDYGMHPLREIISINHEDQFIMDIIKENMDIITENTTSKNIKNILLGEPEGFIVINIDRQNKYYIQGIIVFEYGKAVGTRSIALLYGKFVKLRDELVLRLIEHLKETNDYDQLAIYVNSYNMEDNYIYQYANFIFERVNLDKNGELLSISFVYKA